MRCVVDLVSLKDGGWYCTVLGAGCLGSRSSGWCDALAVGCIAVASGGVELARPVYLKACLVVANSLMRSPVAHACHSIGFLDIRW